MKKYLMTGIAALAMGGMFTSCSHDMSIYSGSQSEQILQKYEQTFVQTFGEPASTQTWGFGSSTTAGTRGMTRSNPGDDYPATSTGINANANEWADPNKEYGGWLVPDPLTAGQKLRVQKYFQANPNLSYEDPHFRHFFVQQVYKGGTDPGANSTEVVTAADGSKYTSDNMNHLTVGFNEQHINNFNAGTCSTNGNVLSNGGNVNDGPFHSDEIMLMVNIDDTECFGYHDSGSSNQSSANPNHNDKMALVSAATIDAWAAANGNPGEAVVDKWNRSFMGFDLAIKEGLQACETDANGNMVYATYNQAAESPQYAWDGENIVQITTGEWETVVVGNEWATWTESRPAYKDEFKSIMGCGWLTTNKNFYIAAEQVSMPQTISMNRAQASTITEIQNAPVLKDVMVNNDYYQSVINLPRIKQLVDEGYLPVKDKNLAEWVKIGKSDGYFSDWIVTLTKAERIPQGGEGGGGGNQDVIETIRIIAEDLTVNQRSDFDFNDVVFDVMWNTTKNTVSIKLLAAGGELPIYIGNDDNAREIHELFSEANPTRNITVKTMMNTYQGQHNSYSCPEVLLDDNWWSGNNIQDIANSIMLRVQKSGTQFVLKAPKGEAPSKIAVGTDYEWCDERQDIEEKYGSKFTEYVGGAHSWDTWYK